MRYSPTLVMMTSGSATTVSAKPKVIGPVGVGTIAVGSRTNGCASTPILPTLPLFGPKLAVMVAVCGGSVSRLSATSCTAWPSTSCSVDGTTSPQLDDSATVPLKPLALEPSAFCACTESVNCSCSPTVPPAGSVASSAKWQAAWSSLLTHRPQVQCWPVGHESSTSLQR